jgi:hypothetical protein
LCEEGGNEEGRERERALGVRLRHNRLTLILNAAAFAAARPTVFVVVDAFGAT